MAVIESTVSLIMPYQSRKRLRTDPSARPGAAYVLNAALKGELGLQITPRRTDFDIIIVDHVESPSPN